MASENSKNPKKGRDFQEKVKGVLDKKFNKKHESLSVAIGKPPKNHNYDLVSKDQEIFVECKCLTWTITGNSPSAKLAAINEAVFLLSFLSASKRKIIVLNKATHPKREKTLARHYFDTYKHLLGDIEIFELDEKDSLNQIK